MKNFITFLLIVSFLPGFSQNNVGEPDLDFLSQKQYFSIGFHLHEYGQEFGAGFHITSPHLFHSSFMLKASGSINMLDYIPENSTSYTSDIFQMYQFGISGLAVPIVNRIWIYGEGGAVIVIPDEAFSSQQIELGGYGLFGFEFILSEYGTNSFFLEAGATGIRARADRSINNLQYVNGFLMTTGFRMKL